MQPHGQEGIMYTDHGGTTLAGHTSWDELRKDVVDRVGEDVLADGVKEAALEQWLTEHWMELLVVAGVFALAELRKKSGQSQVDLATALKVSQPEISRVEHEPDPKLSTVRSYVEALGGQLHLVAEVDGEIVKLELGDAA